MIIISAIVKPSENHGLGLFTTQSIGEGENITRPSTPSLDITLSDDEFSKLAKSEKHYIAHFGFKDKVSGKWCLAFDNTRFINHSNSGNITFDTKSGCLIALRAIAPGEELTQNYREFEELRKELQ